jgi:hypothetical protein
LFLHQKWPAPTDLTRLPTEGALLRDALACKLAALTVLALAAEIRAFTDAPGLVLCAGAEDRVPSSAARKGGRVDRRRAVMILDKGSGSRSNERSFCKHASLLERAALCAGAMFAEYKPGFGSVCKHSYTIL